METEKREWNNRHLEYKLNIPVRICTDKPREELEGYLTQELNQIKGIYTIVGKFDFEDITLCDCDAFECNEETYNV